MAQRPTRSRAATRPLETLTGVITAWSRPDPSAAWEVERHRRIQAIQGKGNRFVEDYAALFGKTAAATPATPPAAPMAANPSGWTCGTKSTGGQRTSWEEAKFYLTRCRLQGLDRDGDGVPCASRCRP